MFAYIHMHMYSYIYIYTHIDVCIYIYTRAYIHILYTYTCMHACACIRECVHMCTCVDISVCMYIYIYIHMYVCIYIYIYTDRQREWRSHVQDASILWCKSWVSRFLFLKPSDGLRCNCFWQVERFRFQGLGFYSLGFGRELRSMYQISDLLYSAWKIIAVPYSWTFRRLKHNLGN